MKLRPSQFILFCACATSVLGAFFVFHTASAQNILIDYFTKVYLSGSTSTRLISQTASTNFGVIAWLPGKEFEVFIPKDQATPFPTVPTHATPAYVQENLEKKIELLQQPTAEEKRQTIAAQITEHNLPIAVLNVWRPHTVIKIKNLTADTWRQDTTWLTSSDHQGNLSFFRDPTWVSPRVITTMTEATVPPQGIATFDFLLDGRGQADRVYDHRYQLEVGGTPVHLDAKGALYWLTRVDPYTPY